MNNQIKMRFLTVMIAIGIALLYALPNLYVDQPSLIFTPNVTNTANITQVLENQGIAHKWQDKSLRFVTVDDQMLARELLTNHVPPQTEMTLNLESQTPNWLQRIGAQAMKLGLDLCGGIHFLLEVDTTDIEKHKDEGRKLQITELLKTHRVRYTDIVEGDQSQDIFFLNQEEKESAAHVLSMYMPTLAMSVDDTHIRLKAENQGEAKSYVVEQTVDSLEKRINELGISEATIQRQGDQHISIDLPGIQDIVRAKKIIGKTATLRFHLVTDDEKNAFFLNDQQGTAIPLNQQSILQGDSIAFAHAKLNDGRAVVEIQLDGHAHDFYQATAQHVGERLAVVYSEIKQDAVVEEYVISAPYIQQPLGDHFIIQGSSSLAEAKDLALLLRSGALAAPVKFVEETIIGPSLGYDNIFKGVLSLCVGSMMIFIFMAYYYRLLGMIANVALLLNIVVIVAVLSLLGATLTLPGIAGIVLSVGMAVDANVLINERIREETLTGASIREAVKAGYSKALSAIVDANITTLLVTFVLFSFGSGAVKGFAITTCIGILSSIFTSVYVTKILTEFMIAIGWVKTISLNHDWFSALPYIDFMKNSKKAFIFSILLLSSCLAILPIKGINLGLDFTGGQQIILETGEDVSSEKVRSALEALEIHSAQVQTYGASNVFLIKIAKENRSVDKLAKCIVSKIRGSRLVQTEFIGPQVGSAMLRNSCLAVVGALAVMMVYVAMRFEYRFALSAIVSLVHDPVLILGIFSLFQIEFNLIALAAVLTILGYSINDTIVVYDRVRETFKSERNQKTASVMNKAINQTLSRTILTSCLTLIVVLALYFLGGDYLEGFSLSLAIGIIIGTYSSIYIAGSLAVYLGLKREDLIIKPVEN